MWETIGQPTAALLAVTRSLSLRPTITLTVKPINDLSHGRVTTAEKRPNLYAHAGGSFPGIEGLPEEKKEEAATVIKVKRLGEGTPNSEGKEEDRVGLEEA